MVAMPRTGSSYLADLLDNHPDFEVHTELFHRQAVFLKVADRERLLPILSAVFRTSFADIYDPRLVERAHDDPTALLSVLAQHRTARYLTLKVFPRHLDAATLNERLLRPKGIAHLLLSRDPLSTFVSQLKARCTKQWSHQDTSRLQVTIDTDEFLQYVEQRQNWYDHCRRQLTAAGRAFEELTYEELIGADSDAVALKRVLDLACKVGIRSEAAEPAASIQVRPKQDRTAAISESVENWASFVTIMRRRSRDDLLP